ncbi:hypothetical protein OQA88_976 [Cercophora sp. LCS_1]
MFPSQNISKYATNPAADREAWVDYKISRIHRDYKRPEHASERKEIIEFLRGVKCIINGSEIRIMAPSGQIPYDRLKNLLDRHKFVPPALAETVRLIYPHEEYPYHLIENLRRAGWHHAKVNLPGLPEVQRRFGVPVLQILDSESDRGSHDPLSQDSPSPGVENPPIKTEGNAIPWRGSDRDRRRYKVERRYRKRTVIKEEDTSHRLHSRARLSERSVIRSRTQTKETVINREVIGPQAHDDERLLQVSNGPERDRDIFDLRPQRCQNRHAEAAPAEPPGRPVTRHSSPWDVPARPRGERRPRAAATPFAGRGAVMLPRAGSVRVKVEREETPEREALVREPTPVRASSVVTRAPLGYEGRAEFTPMPERGVKKEDEDERPVIQAPDTWLF